MKINLTCIMFACCACAQMVHADVPQEVRNAFRSGNARTIQGEADRVVSRLVDSGPLKEDSLLVLLENKEVEHTYYVGCFFKNIAKESRNLMGALQDAEFCEFLLKDISLFQQLSWANRGNERTFDVIRAIWLKEGKKLEGVDLTAALGCGLATRPEQKDCIEQSLQRYAFYKESRKNGNLFQQYDQLKAWEMATLFQHTWSVDDLQWAQSFGKTNKNFKASSAGGVAMQFIPYREKNKAGISVHAGGAFYDNKPITLKILHEYGGVCGAVSKGAAGFLASRGIPAYPVGQPGHCAFVWKNIMGEWVVGNDIYGWSWSDGHSGWIFPGRMNMSPWAGPPAMVSSAARFEQSKEAKKSELCRGYAALSRNKRNHDYLLEQSLLKANGKNVAAWKDLIANQPKNISPEEKYKLAQRIVSAFHREPVTSKYLIDEFLPLHVKNPEKYKTIAQIVPKENVDGITVQLYMISFWKCFLSDVPDLKGKLTYDVKTRGNFYEQWLDFYKKNKIKSFVKKKTLLSLEQSIEGLLPNSSISESQLSFYLDCQKLWNDRMLLEQGSTFLRKLIADEKSVGLRSALIKTGMGLAELSNNKNDMKYFGAL